MSTNFARPSACPKVLRILLLAGSAAAALTGLSVHAQQRGGQTLETVPVPSTPIAGDFSLAAVGDLIYLRPMLATLEKQAPEMLRILRGADVTFGNFETTALDLATFKGSPQAESGGTWMLADPGVPKDVAAMGIDIVGHANNHATDWGVEGMIETLKLLDAAKLVRAGTGRTMAEARAPAYYDGPQGRVALVSATTTFTPMTPAADPLAVCRAVPAPTRSAAPRSDRCPKPTLRCWRASPERSRARRCGSRAATFARSMLRRPR